jgi:tetratricopeptide (TPR) repeat protein
MKIIMTKVLLGVLVLSANIWAQTSEIHYRQGLRELEEGQLTTAAEEFQRARSLMKTYAPAYVGLALVEMERQNYGGALELLKVGKRYDKKLVDVYVAKSRIYRRAGQGKWEKKALAELKRAEKIDSRDDRVPFYRGIVYRVAGNYSDAVLAFGACVAMRGPMGEKAVLAQHQIQLMVRALSEVKHSGNRIALASVVTRGDLALVLLDEFEVKKWVLRRRPERADLAFKEHLSVASPTTLGSVLPGDIATYPKRHAILDVLELEIPGLELFPDGRFGPNEPVTRASYAQIMQGLLALDTKESDLATKYFGETSRFTDLRSDHFAYNAAILCIQRGILQPRSDGLFGPDDPVSGAEAILGIKVALGL